MLNQLKFSKLKKITKYFKIAAELEEIRNDLAERKTPDISDLKTYYEYLLSEEDSRYTSELISVINENNNRIMLEKAQLLYHTIREDFGYPVSENQFIKSSKDSNVKLLPKTELVIILENLRSAFNVGSIIRSCECFGVKELILCGITPGTENQRTLKTAKGTSDNIQITRSESVKETILDLKKHGYSVTGAETGSGSRDLNEYQFQAKTAIIFGNEEIGITADILDLCDDIVSIKMRGRKNSLNVANAASIFLYEYVRQN